MAKEPVIVTINDDDGAGHEYVFTPLGASAGVRLGRTIMAIAGVPLGHLAGAVKGGGAASAMDADLDGDALSGALRSVTDALLEHGNEKLFLDLLKHTTRDGHDVSQLAVFDLVYQANYGELFFAIYKVLWVNFGPLFARLAGGVTLEKLAKLMANKVPGLAGALSQTSTPATSTG